jgi:N-hydroxyarylamine O-acetyltransferase
VDVDAYLDRIHIKARPGSNYDGLRILQEAHLLTVPFENLDIVPLRRGIKLDEESLLEKIVLHHRGGFCYELNGGFAWLLKQQGYAVTYLNARVYSRDGRLGIEFDHLALLVGVAGQTDLWLADVGFGDSFVEPLILGEGEQTQGRRAYRLEKAGNGYIVWQRDDDQKWERLYFFDPIPRDFPADYQAACLYHSESSESHFTQQPIITRLTPEGRISLQKDRLITTTNGIRQETPLEPEEWPRLLKEHFGVVLQERTTT